MSPTEAQVIVITGGTGGLGLATAQALIEDSEATDGGSMVLILTARTVEKGRQAPGLAHVEALAKEKSGVEVVVMALEIDEEASVQRFRADVEERYGRIDVLVSNAAAHLDFAIDGEKLTTAQAFTRTLHTNITATHTLVTVLLPLLFVPAAPASRRIVFVSSGISSLANHSDPRISINAPPPAGYPKQPSFNILTYRTSKTGLNMLALEWARILRHDAFTVHILDPGLLATTLGGVDPVKIKAMGAEDPIVGGRFVRDVVRGKLDDKAEVLLGRNGVVPW